ncbi:MAG: DoxX family protein [Phycisphaerales bacterium]
MHDPSRVSTGPTSPAIPPTAATPRPGKAALIVGWLLTVLPALLLLVSGAMKIIQPPGFADAFGVLGYPIRTAVPIGIVEIVCTLLYLIPRTSVLGAMLLLAYLGGAVATHVRVEDQFVTPIILGVVLWLGLYLREPRLRRLVSGRG